MAHAQTAPLQARLEDLRELGRFVPDKALDTLLRMEPEARAAAIGEKAEFLAQMCQARLKIGQHQQALAICDELIVLARQNDNDIALAKGLLQKAYVVYAMGEQTASHQLVWESEKIAAGTKDNGLKIRVAITSGEAYAEEGNFPLALTRLESAAARARVDGQPVNMVMALNSLAKLYDRMREYDISPDTTVGVGLSHSDSKSRPMIYGVPLRADGSDVGLSRSTYTGAAWNRGNIEQTMLYADLDHRFNADWKLKVAAIHLSEKNTSKHQRMHGDVAADGSGMTYANWITDFDSSKVGLDAYVTGRFEALGLRHETTVGANYSKYTSDDMFARTFTTGGNLFAIDHNRPEPTVASMLASGGRQYRAAYDVQQKGIYASLRSRITEPLTAIVGARASWYDSIYDDKQAGTRSITTASREITPYAGLVYALTPQWSAYGSYTGVFVPQSERTAAGNVLEPIIGKNYELGVKGELMEGRVNTSLAVFRYDHNKRAVNDLEAGFACDGWYCSRNSGKVRSQGFEAEVSGEVVRNLQLMAGYTYNTTEFLSDPEEQGKVFSTVTPKHMLRAWASYRLPGDWNQLTVAGGFNTQSHTLGYDRSFKLAGFTVGNLRLSYQATRELNVAVNVNNVFDKRYVLPGYVGYTGASYGEPRNVMLTVKYTPKL